MEVAVDDDALRARRGPAAAYEAGPAYGERPAVAVGARRLSIDRRASAGTSPPVSGFAYRYGRASTASATTSPNMMPAAFLHQEMEPMVSSRALPPPSLSTSTSPMTTFAPGFFSNSDSSRSGSSTTWTERSTGSTRALLSSASSTAAASSFHWSPTPLGALYASQTPLLAPNAAANALATMSTTTTSVLSAMPPPTPTPSLTVNGADPGGNNGGHPWRFSATLNAWSGPNNSANSVGSMPPAHWPTNDEQQPLQLSPLTRGRGYLSTSPLNSRLMAQVPPLVLPPPPSASTATATIATKPAASRKRKRAPGAQRLRNFLCMHPSCGKSFTDSAHLRDHTVVHTGEKRLSCATCDRRFARLSTLHEHQRVHTGEKPYVCSTPGCEKRYSSRAALRVHVATHSGIPSSRRRRDAGLQHHTNNTGYAGDSGHSSAVTGSLEERAVLTSRVSGHDRYPASGGYSLSDPPSYMVPPSDETAPVATQVTDPADTMDASRTTLTEYTPAPTSEQGHETLVGSSTQSLEDTVREQRDQIALLQQELERLRQQPQPERRKRSTRRQRPTITRKADDEDTMDAAPAARVAAPMTAPVEFLQDGVKPFACCICLQRFVNYYQLTFHAKQHAGAPLATVIGQNQAPLPVGPKFCPERGCEFSEVTGRSLRSLQTLKRHWQRRHQPDRPHVCAICLPHHRKAFKTRENLKAHEKDCHRLVAAPASASVSA